MDDLISRQAAIDAIMGEYPEVHYPDWYASIIKELPPVQPKTGCSCEQIKWERDMAIAQLNELGYGLGGKPRTGHMVEPQESEDKE